MVDPFTGEAWVGTNQKLLRFSPNGEPLAGSQRPIDHLAAVTDGDKLLGLWVVDGTGIAFVDPELRELFALQPFGDTPRDRITGLTLDPHTGSAWITDGQRLAEVSPGGSNNVRYDLGQDAAVEGLMVQRLERLPLAPQVEILSPAEGAVLTDRRPEVSLRLVAGDYEPRAETLEVQVGGFPLVLECEAVADLRYDCTPEAELPLGSLLLSASVADAKGHRGEAVARRFTLRDEPAREGEIVANSGEPSGQPEYTPVVSPRGLRPNTPFYVNSDFDYVDTASGNLTIAIPIGQEYTVGPLLSYQVRAVYNSNAWGFHRTCVLDLDNNCDYSTVVLTNPNNNAGLGWEVHFGRLYAPEAPPELQGSLEAKRWPNRELGSFEGDRWMYVAPDGATHYLYPLPGRTNTLNSRPVRYSKDGSFLRMVQTTSNRIEISAPDGVVSVFAKTAQFEGTNYCGAGVTGCWRLLQIKDPYGNAINFSYSKTTVEETWTVTDSTQRTHRLRFDLTNAGTAGNDCNSSTQDFCSPNGDEWGDLRRVLTSVELATFGSQSSTYSFVTTPHRMSRGCTLETDVSTSAPSACRCSSKSHRLRRCSPSSSRPTPCSRWAAAPPRARSRK